MYVCVVDHAKCSLDAVLTWPIYKCIGGSKYIAYLGVVSFSVFSKDGDVV